MTFMSRPCAWANANPEKTNPDHRYCAGWQNQCEREGCVRKKGAAARRKTELSSYRKFPGNDLQQARHALVKAAYDAGQETKSLRLPRAHCTWCEQPILKHDGTDALNTRRGWHDGRNGEDDCLLDYYQHTRLPEQLALVGHRQGARCAGCGAYKGHWSRSFEVDPAKLHTWGPSWIRRFPPDVFVAPFLRITLSASLEVDHVIPLAVVALTIPEPLRWAYWGPPNLQGLCHDCHAVKTREDVRLIRSLQKAAAV